MIGVTSLVIGEPLQVEIEGEAAILINGETGAILFEKDAYTPRYPASTTKVGTALYMLHKKRHELDTILTAEQEVLVTITPEVKRKANFTLPAYWHETDGTHIGLKKGEEMAFRDLLHGILIVSGNDAANVASQWIGGTIPQFIKDLNEFLKSIGCQQTNFCNPHGLHHPDHKTTPYDLALMTKEALKDPFFCEIVSQTRFVRPKTNKQKSVILAQGNRLLRPGKFYYSKAIGVKTGYHSRAKHNLVAAARYNDRILIAVLMGYQRRNGTFEDAIKLFEAAFNQPKIQRIFLPAGAQKFTVNLPKAEQPIGTYLSENLNLEYYPAEDPQVKCLLYWDPLSLPIQKGQKIGHIQLITASGLVLKQVPLLALQDVGYVWPYSWIENRQTLLIWVSLTAGFLLLLGWFFWKRSR